MPKPQRKLLARLIILGWAIPLAVDPGYSTQAAGKKQTSFPQPAVASEPALEAFWFQDPVHHANSDEEDAFAPAQAAKQFAWSSAFSTEQLSPLEGEAWVEGEFSTAPFALPYAQLESAGTSSLPSKLLLPSGIGTGVPFLGGVVASSTASSSGDSAALASTPEPTTLLLLATGLGVQLCRRRKRPA
jgi:PEP-CTERM motif